MNPISRRIQAAIAAKGNISNRKLEELTGIPKSAIQRYISGTTDRIPIDRLKLIASALNVTPAYLMGLETSSGDPINLVDDEQIDSLMIIASQLNPDNQKLAVDFLSVLLSNQQKSEKK